MSQGLWPQQYYSHKLGGNHRSSTTYVCYNSAQREYQAMYSVSNSARFRYSHRNGRGDEPYGVERDFASIFPDCEIGAMPPFGNLYDLRVYVDRTLTSDQTIVFQAGTHNDTMRIPYADFARLVKPTIVDIARSPRIAAGHY
jgi:hypothetical protein